MRIEESLEPDTTTFPCRLTHLTVEVCPSSTCRQAPFLTSHTLRLRSVLPDTTMFPSNSEHQTPPVCPLRVDTHLREGIDHSLRVLSSDPLTMRSPLTCRQVITLSSCPFRILGGLSECIQLFSIDFLARNSCLNLLAGPKHALRITQLTLVFCNNTCCSPLLTG